MLCQACRAPHITRKQIERPYVLRQQVAVATPIERHAKVLRWDEDFPRPFAAGRRRDIDLSSPNTDADECKKVRGSERGC